MKPGIECETFLTQTELVASFRDATAEKKLALRRALLGPSHERIINAYRYFEANLYRIGRDKASAMGYASIESSCQSMGDTYEPGHLPPG